MLGGLERSGPRWVRICREAVLDALETVVEQHLDRVRTLRLRTVADRHDQFEHLRSGSPAVVQERLLEKCPTAGVSVWLGDREIDTGVSCAISLFDLATMTAFHL